MFAVISSTIFPSPSLTSTGQSRSSLSPDQRLSQTRETIESLLEFGISDIFVADNSGDRWRPGAEDILSPAKIHVMHSAYEFDNKGISELMLLLQLAPFLPDGVPLIKISGRYRLVGRPPDVDGNWDVAGRIYRSSKPINISTRLYYARNSAIFSSLLKDTLRECFAYSGRAVGLRSAARIVKNLFSPNLDFPYEQPMVPIESAMAFVILARRLKLRELANLGVRGQFGASSPIQHFAE